MKLHGKKILVTGADGFIGSHLTEELLRRGHDVRAFVMYNSFNSWGWLDVLEVSQRNNLNVICGDIRDPLIVRQAMAGCDVVFHLAALIAIPYSYHAPSSYVDTNIHGTLNILQAARDLSVSRIIHTSTSEVYGTAQFVPINENHPLQAQSPYAATKIAADQLALSFHRSFDLPVTVMRPFNTFGPRQSARAVIPTIISQLAAGQSAISLGNVNATRDFSYVRDTVKGFIMMAESDAAVGEVVNVGSGYEISIKQLVELIADLSKCVVEIIVDQERIRPENSEVERLVADNAKAKWIAGWSPDYNGSEGLALGLKQTIDWFADKNNIGMYKTRLYNI